MLHSLGSSVAKVLVPLCPFGDLTVGTGKLVSADDCGSRDDAVGGVGVEALRTQFHRTKRCVIVNGDSSQPVRDQTLTKSARRQFQFDPSSHVGAARFPRR